MSDDESRIDKLEEDLYSRQAEHELSRDRRELHEQEFEAATDWQPDSMKGKKHNTVPVIKIVLLVAVVFFIASAAFATFVVVKAPAISPKNVTIDIQGPAQVGGGEELALQVTIVNKNPVPIMDVDLIVEYPDGTRATTDINTELPRHRESIGEIKSGDQIKRTVRSVLFGEENSIQDINVIVEFRVETSNAIFFNDSTYQISLATPPLSLVVEGLDEAISGQDVSFVMTVRSNSKDIIEDALLEVEYPFGFEFTSAQPKPAFANRLWHLGDIAPEEEKKITLNGVLVGQDGEERVFRFATGIQSKSDPNTLGAAFINVMESVFVQRPFIGVDLLLNGNASDSFFANTSNKVRGEIIWKNNLPTQVFDAEIEVIFKGDALDEFSVTADNGFYQSLNNTISWNRQTFSQLHSIPAGDSGRVSFTFAPIGLASGIPFRNPEIDIDVNVRAKRLSDTQVPEEILSTLTRKVRISSDIFLASEILHFTGPISNTGPIPPRAEQETTYTVVLSITNSSNQVDDVIVSATLPTYMSWGGIVSPSNEVVSYNPVGGQIIWRVGDISAGTGRATPPREIAFQVKLLPSLAQIGGFPILINNQTLTGEDRFTGEALSHTQRELTTRVREPGFPQRGDTVTQ